jgi:tRNA (guanosine-2'-O-)-methyltransferase
MNSNEDEIKKMLFDHLAGFITAQRLAKFREIINLRTRYITVVLEDIYQPHNASAVLRSCDCFGVQDVHIIENRNRYEVNPDVALGSSKWLTMIKYNSAPDNTPEALTALRRKGYRIVATTPHQDDVTLQELPVEKGPVALLFGTELKGLTDTALSLADEYVKIPMYGFTESFNISVSAGISLFYLTEKIRNSNIDWQLPENEKIDILLDWAKQTVKRADLLEKEFLKNLSAR